MYKYLNRGFIILNKIAYTLPVLFTFKLNGKWRFYMDYQKLNYIIKKDKYPLLLIDDIFHRIIRIKVFTKLNIRYIFYRIRIHLNSEELTVFGIYYKAY